MKEYYECHITMETSRLASQNFIEYCIDVFGWKFSAIDGDPDLGKGIKCYATKQFNKKHSLIDIASEMNTLAKKLRDEYSIKILRRKVEVVVYDDREVL